MDKLVQLAEKYASLMKEAEEYIWNNPETGYKEFKTDEYMRRKFEELGYEITRAEGITGFYTLVAPGKEYTSTPGDGVYPDPYAVLK